MVFNNEWLNFHIGEKLNIEMQAFGDVKYAYAVMNKRNPQNIVVLNNHPEWVDIYISNCYQLIDPVIIKSLGRVEDFRWDDAIMISSAMKLPKIFKVGEKYNVKAGHTFILHDCKGNLALLSLMSSNHDARLLDELIAAHKAAFQLLLVSTHQTLLSQYKKNERLSHRRTGNIFSQRESEVLFWSSTGKTYNEIAIMLNITLSTVKFHMGNVVKKLGVSNARHAVKLSAELGLLFIPTHQP